MTEEEVQGWLGWLTAEFESLGATVDLRDFGDSILISFRRPDGHWINLLYVRSHFPYYSPEYLAATYSAALSDYLRESS